MLDTGAQISVVTDLKLLHNYTSNITRNITAANMGTLNTMGEGILILRLSNNVVVQFPAVYSEETPSNILSVMQLTAKQKITVDFYQRKMLVQDHNINIDIIHRNGFYWLSSEYLVLNETNIHSPADDDSPVSISLCHIRENTVPKKKWSLEFIHNLLAHVNIKQIRKSISNGDIRFIKLEDIDWSDMNSFTCQYCNIGKGKFHDHFTDSRDVYMKKFKKFEYLHTDIMGPFREDNTIPPNYLITFSDEVTKYRWIFPMSLASEHQVSAIMRKLISNIRTQQGVRVKEILMDQGSQYTGRMVRDLLDEFGIEGKYTSTGDKRSNGVAERLNRTLLDDARTLLASANLPEFLWYDAAEFAVIVRNSMHMRKLDGSPNMAAGLGGIAINKILPFGQPVVVYYNTGKKTLPRGKIVYALHPAKQSYGYTFYDPSSKQTMETTNYKIINTIQGDYLNSEENLDTLNQVDDIVRQRSNDPSTDSQRHITHRNQREQDYISQERDPTDEPQQPESDSTETHGNYLRTHKNEFQKGIATHTLGKDSRYPVRNSSDVPSQSPQEVQETLPVALSPASPPNNIFISQERLMEEEARSVKHPTKHVPAENGKRPAQRDELGVSTKRPNTKASPEQCSPIPEHLSHNDDTTDTSSLNEEERRSLYDKLSAKYRDSSIELQSTDSLYGGGGSDIGDLSNPDKQIMGIISCTKTELKINDSKSDQNHEHQIDAIVNMLIQENPVQTYDNIKHENRVKIPLVNSLKMVRSLPNTKIDRSLSYSQAITKNSNHQEREAFKEAYDSEIAQLMRRGTWDTTEVDIKSIEPHKLLNTMFIFTTKRDGRKKCRLVVRGDLQHWSTYEKHLESNTIHHYALMTILSVALEENMIVKQLDITAAYLYADLKEELYIRTPPHMKMPNKAFRLRKSLYGLKQSGANWYGTITSFLKERCGLKEDKIWSCVFTKEPPLSIIVCIFVDDIIVTGKDTQEIERFLEQLRSTYETKLVHDGKMGEDGTARYDILGLDLEYKRNGYMKFGMLDILSHKLPLLNLPLREGSRYNQAPVSSSSEPPKVDKNLYVTEKDYKSNVKKLQQVVGLLSYVAHKFRFEALYHVNVLAQYQLYPTDEVMKWANESVQYFWNTKEKRLVWTKNKTPVDYEFTIISDASDRCEPEGKSRLGWFYEIYGHKISARSTKSSYVCDSSTGAEICAMKEATKFDFAISALLFTLTGKRPRVRLLSDNKPALGRITNPNSTVSPFKPTFTRTMELREKHNEGLCDFTYIPTEQNVADILTKVLSAKRFNRLTNGWLI
ncbi:conserved hypothetical protein [Kluyveromyces marxianus DMKU3-1042]|uniref:Uncharacterized protein n=1 Tax=Kluyveromyces marxianus (strain DMKU3-1042 / BCC 29191 / NBRC 104275) TaxID=1003335 RepID=W0TEB8_KLUMD|nr:uncharacterized protein KLMA_40420 [Kluyveromyces marxianus DMKU3-1042]BAO40444.1 conserved hypothetical protein [Kluyveromyces marxianus DMKU3-1042]